MSVARLGLPLVVLACGCSGEAESLGADGGGPTGSARDALGSNPGADSGGPDAAMAPDADGGDATDARRVEAQLPVESGVPAFGDEELVMMLSERGDRDGELAEVRHGNVGGWDCTAQRDRARLWVNFELYSPELRRNPFIDRNVLASGIQFLLRDRENRVVGQSASFAVPLSAPPYDPLFLEASISVFAEPDFIGPTMTDAPLLLQAFFAVPGVPRYEREAWIWTEIAREGPSCE